MLDCACETAGFPLGSSVFMILSLEDSSEQLSHSSQNDGEITEQMGLNDI